MSQWPGVGAREAILAKFALRFASREHGRNRFPGGFRSNGNVLVRPYRRCLVAAGVLSDSSASVRAGGLDPPWQHRIAEVEKRKTI